MRIREGLRSRYPSTWTRSTHPFFGRRTLKSRWAGCVIDTGNVTLSEQPGEGNVLAMELILTKWEIKYFRSN